MLKKVNLSAIVQHWTYILLSTRELTKTNIDEIKWSNSKQFVQNFISFPTSKSLFNFLLLFLARFQVYCYTTRAENRFQRGGGVGYEITCFAFKVNRPQKYFHAREGKFLSVVEVNTTRRVKTVTISIPAFWILFESSSMLNLTASPNCWNSSGKLNISHFISRYQFNIIHWIWSNQTSRAWGEEWTQKKWNKNLSMPRLSRKISITVPGFFRLISNPSRGTSSEDPATGEASLVSKTVKTLQTCALCIAMGRSICEYKAFI